jgi:hypothetical protein
MSTLIAFMRGIEGTYTDPQWSRVRVREAERLGIEAADWSAVRAMNFDLVMVREANRAASTRESVRRANRDGVWKLVSAQPGKLRSQPQSFRAGTLVESAWDHRSLRQRVATLVNETRDAAPRAPARTIATFIRAFVRAQPFLGENEHTALIVASALCRSLGLPGLYAQEIRGAPEFVSALIADDAAVMERVVDAALWREALALAEWIAPAPTHARWTLADEHAVLNALRTPTDLCGLAEQAVKALEPLLHSPTGARHVEHVHFIDRARATTDATYRGRSICPQTSIFESRWSLPGERDAVLITALAGRGISRAASIHLSIEHPQVVNTQTAPALLFPFDEASAERAARLATWLPTALRDAG